MSCQLYVERKDESGNWVLVPSEGTFKDRWSLSQRLHFLAMLGGEECEDVPPICEPRGLPADISSGLMEIWDQTEKKEKPSYFTLPEVLTWDEKTFTASGYLGLEEFEKYVESGKKKVEKAYKNVPRNSIIFTNQKMERVINMSQFMDENTYFTLLEWQEPYSGVDKYFWNQVVPQIKELDENPENLRIVFWFDS